MEKGQKEGKSSESSYLRFLIKLACWRWEWEIFKENACVRGCIFLQWERQ